MKKMLCIGMILSLLLCISGCGGEKDFASAKISAQEYLNTNVDQLEHIALQELQAGKASAVSIKGVSSVLVSEDMVIFEIGSQGMLGGQYWSLVYTKDGSYHGEKEQYIYREETGNNVTVAHHLLGNWFFLWTDYDGREDLTNRYIQETAAS